MSILAEIQNKLYLTTKKKTVNVLEGAYKAAMHSRSMDVDDLKEYTPGDNSKDIAWKATARSPKLLVKRFIADKQFPVLFVVDTGKNMKAVSGALENKQEILEGVIGVLGKVVLKHNDTLGAVYGDAETTKRLPFRNSRTHLEVVLQKVREQVESDKTCNSSVVSLLKRVMEFKISRSIIVVISDNPVVDEDFQKLISNVTHKHDLLWVSISDANPFELPLTVEVEDVETSIRLPAYIRSKKTLKTMHSEQTNTLRTVITSLFTKNQVSYAEVNSFAEIVPALNDMLLRRKHGKR